MESKKQENVRKQIFFLQAQVDFLASVLSSFTEDSDELPCQSIDSSCPFDRSDKPCHQKSFSHTDCWKSLASENVKNGVRHV